MAGHTVLDVDAHVAAELSRFGSDVEDLMTRYAKLRDIEPQPGSRAEADLALADGRYVSIHATQAAHMALDHLLAWKLLLDGGTAPVLAHMTLIRGALEGAVRCRWLIEAAKSPSVRVARGWSAKRHDFEERDRYEKVPPINAKGVMTAAERLIWLEARREAGEIQKAGYADVTSLMMKYHLEKPYRLTSGFAHALEWPFGEMSINDLVESSPGVISGMVTASDEVVLELTQRAFAAVKTAMAELEGYYAPRRAKRGEAGRMTP